MNGAQLPRQSWVARELRRSHSVGVRWAVRLQKGIGTRMAGVYWALDEVGRRGLSCAAATSLRSLQSPNPSLPPGVWGRLVEAPLAPPALFGLTPGLCFVSFFQIFLSYTEAGSSFVFGDTLVKDVFAFQVS